MTDFTSLGLSEALLRAIDEQGYKTPTRELAAQIAENVKAYSRYIPIRSLVVFGGVSINPQMMKLRGGVDVL
ncbi:DEAD/DEAH box helicase, partial [Proteus terrae]